MSYELLYTSAPSGLKPGSRGFTTVVATKGLPSALFTRLETLSAYRHIFLPQDPRAAENPVAYSHLKLKSGGRSVSVLSRVAAYGVDYSGRTNKLAHHLVIDPAEYAPAGPAWLLAQPGLLKSQWDQNLKTPEAGPRIPMGDHPAAICRRWASIAGDAGWAGKLAEHFAKPSARPLWLLYSIDQREILLGLIQEAIALLPPSDRWQATFTTYAMNLPPEVDCRLRCVPLEAPEARQVGPHNRLIDLSQPSTLNEASPWIDLARSGRASNPQPTRQNPASKPDIPVNPIPQGLASSLPPSLNDEFRLQAPVIKPKSGNQTRELPPRIVRDTNAQDSQLRIMKIVAAVSAAVLLAAVTVIVVVSIARPGSVKPIEVAEGKSKTGNVSQQSDDAPITPNNPASDLNNERTSPEQENARSRGAENSGSNHSTSNNSSSGSNESDIATESAIPPETETSVRSPPMEPLDDADVESIPYKEPHDEFPIELVVTQIKDSFEVDCTSKEKYLLATSDKMPEGYRWIDGEKQTFEGQITDNTIDFSHTPSYLKFSIARTDSTSENWLHVDYALNNRSINLEREKLLPCIANEISLAINVLKAHKEKVSTLRVDNKNAEAQLFMNATTMINSVLMQVKDYSPSNKSKLTTDIDVAIDLIDQFCTQDSKLDKPLGKDSVSQSELSFGQICDGLNKLKDALQQLMDHDLSCLELNLGSLILYAPSAGLSPLEITKKEICIRVIFNKLTFDFSQTSVQ